MTKDPTARLVQNELAQLVVACDEPRLFPERITGRRIYPANYYVANFAFGVGADDFDFLSGHHSGTMPKADRKAKATFIGLDR